MEGSFAKELYSEIVQLSIVESNPLPDAIDELQDEDGSFWGGSDGELDKASDLDREWQRRRDQFHTIGYRDGLIAGKEAVAQEGFNNGFKRSAVVGYEWGIGRGVTSALVCLPDGLREKLIETEERKNKFQALYESVHSLSTTDALKLFHDDMVTKRAVKRSVDAEAASDIECLQNKTSGCTLENYVEKLKSLLLESPKMESHFSVK